MPFLISKFLLSKKLIISIKCYVQHNKKCSKHKTSKHLPHHGLVPTVWADPCTMSGTDNLYLPLIGNQGEEEEEDHGNDCSLGPHPSKSLVVRQWWDGLGVWIWGWVPLGGGIWLLGWFFTSVGLFILDDPNGWVTDL